MFQSPLRFFWTEHIKMFLRQVRKVDVQYWAVKSSVQQITVPAWARMMHHEEALVWTQQSVWQELKQLFSNETNIPWQLMIENSEDNWGNAAQWNIKIYLQAVRAPLRKQNFVVWTNVWTITTSPGFKYHLSHILPGNNFRANESLKHTLIFCSNTMRKEW